MSEPGLNQYRAHFRKVAQKNSFYAFEAISKARAKSPPELFPSVIKGLQIAAPKHRSLPLQRPKAFQDILYSLPMEPVSLEKELYWAIEWLAPATREINELCSTIDKLQHQFAAGQLGEMQSLLDTFIRRQGWSMWAAELKFALTQQLNGSDSVKTLSTELQQRTKGRASSLFALIFYERNDDSFSFDSFHTKCTNSLVRFKEFWIPAYLPFRATHTVFDPEHSFPIILSCDITSSIFDYYESVIELLQTIRQEGVLAKYRPLALRLIDTLVLNGVTDSRLAKIALGISGSASGELFASYSEPTTPLEMLQSRLVSFQSVELVCDEGNQFLKQMHRSISRADSEGMTSQDDITFLLKLGVNFKSLPIGVSVALKALQCTMKLSDGPIVPFASDMVLPSLSIDDILTNTDEHALTLFGEIANNESGPLRDCCKDIVNVVAGAQVSSVQSFQPNITIWLARYLASHNRIDEATELARRLDSLGGAWARHAAKLRIYIYVRAGDLLASLQEAAIQLLKNSQYAYELPLHLIFEGHKWKEFKELDPVLVGLVSNHAYLASDDATIRFICRMACRSFYVNGHRNNLDEAWSNHRHLGTSELLISFLWDVWTEDNLALVESFKSTQEIRNERIGIFQKLLQWDPDNVQEYSTCIKELTFDETLWRGLKKINETRIFVNEAAITRWAEKELVADFERWRLLRASSTTQPLTDDIIRNYLIDANIEGLLQALPKEEATESNVLLFELLDRLLKRFMTDPTDGLDCYLSLRVRHGSLRGTLFGPLEEEGLLISGPSSEAAFHNRWDSILGLSIGDSALVVSLIKDFTSSLQAIVKTIIEEKIQIGSTTKPKGIFPSSIDKSRISIMVPLFHPDMSFPYFLSTCYETFWQMLNPFRRDLAEYFSGEVKDQLRSEFDLLVKRIRDDQKIPMTLETTLMTVATTTQSQCDAVSDWFVSIEASEKEAYPLSDAISIAKKATENVYRSFDVKILIISQIDEALQLSASGLATLTDCLYVIFENAWKHSGLNERLGEIQLSAEFDSQNKMLVLCAYNNLSEKIRGQLADMELQNLRNKYLAEIPIHLVPKEGGSGFAKLARMTNAVDRTICEYPLDFGIDEHDRWFVKVVIPLYEREGIFDAYD